MQLSTSEETKLLSSGSELDGNSSTDFLADKVGLFRGLLVVSCAMFNSLLLNLTVLQLHFLGHGTGFLCQLYEHHEHSVSLKVNCDGVLHVIGEEDFCANIDVSVLRDSSFSNFFMKKDVCPLVHFFSNFPSAIMDDSLFSIYGLLNSGFSKVLLRYSKMEFSSGFFS